MSSKRNFLLSGMGFWLGRFDVKDSAVVYRNFVSAVRKLPAEKRGEAYEAYMLYALDGVDYEGEDYGISALIESFKVFIDGDKAKYEARKQRAEKLNAGRNRSDIGNGCDDVDTTTALSRDDIVTKSQQERNEVACVDVDVDVNKEKDTNVSKEKAPKHKQGTYGHVLLTDDENQKLFDKFGEPLRTELINYLDQAIEEKGYKYKSHYLTISKEGSWVQEGVKKLKRPKPAWQAEKDARRGQERGTDYDAMLSADFPMNPPEDIGLPFNDPPEESQEEDTLAELMAM